MNHSQWKTVRTRRLLGEQVVEDPAVAALRLEIRYSILFGQALYDRRTELSISKAEVAERSGLTLDEVERIEDGDMVPTLPLLQRLAAALEAELDIHVTPQAETAFRFHSPAA